VLLESSKLINKKFVVYDGHLMKNYLLLEETIINYMYGILFKQLPEEEMNHYGVLKIIQLQLKLWHGHHTNKDY
jgi:hypothetical protein